MFVKDFFPKLASDGEAKNTNKKCQDFAEKVDTLCGLPTVIEHA